MRPLLSLPLCLLSAAALAEEPAPPLRAGVPAADEHGAVWRFGSDTLHDTGSFVTAPLDWDGRDWLIAGGVGATIAGLGFAFDDQIRVDSQEDRTTLRDRFADHINPIGTGVSLLYIAGAWAVGATTDSPRATQLARDGLEGSIIASGVIAPLVKLAAGRTRPDNADPDRWEPFSGNYSFPSGHTTQAFTLASVTAFSFPDQPAVGVLAFGVASLVGLARINGNDHYLSDVLTGAALGTAVGWHVVHENHVRRDAAGLHLSASTQGAALTLIF